MTANAAKLETEVTGPLKGIRILDMTSVVFGAYATQMLGDLGADVIKVEFPGGRRGGGGDIMRWTGALPEGCPPDLGPIFLTINRNKRSVLLDLREDKAARQLRKLIATCDVFAASVRYEGLKRLRLDDEGATAPSAGEPGYDDLVQAGSGLADLLPRTDGDPTPRYLPTLAADKVSGLFMANAITAALLHKERTGEGQFVEVPMLECLVSFNLVENMFGHTFDPPTGQWGYTRSVNPNRKPFPTKDGYIGLLPYTDQQWDQFFEIAGWGETVSKDPRFSDFRTRAAHISELYAMVDEVPRTRTTDEWLELLKPLQIPVVKMNRLDDLFDDPHLKAVGLFEQAQHPEAGPYVSIRPPVKFSASPANIRRHPPRLGQHTDEVLAEIEEKDTAE